MGGRPRIPLPYGWFDRTSESPRPDKPDNSTLGRLSWRALHGGRSPRARHQGEGHESDSPTEAKRSRSARGAARTVCRAAVFFRGPCSVMQFWPRPGSTANPTGAASRPAARWIRWSTVSASDSHQPIAATACREPLCTAPVRPLPVRPGVIFRSAALVCRARIYLAGFRISDDRFS